jgi:hypothetical protein
MQLEKSNSQSSFFAPLESVVVTPTDSTAERILVEDSAGRTYVDQPARAGKALRFQIRGNVGLQSIRIIDHAGAILKQQQIRVKARTQLSCNKAPYAELFDRIQQLITLEHESKPWIINGRAYEMLVCWSRDHVYTLKAAKYWMEDVESGLDYWLDSQTESGMFWDCIYENTEAPAPSWLGEAIGEGWNKYDDGMKYVVRRVPVLADTEYVFTEGVWYAWKASGNDAWMSKQLPRLEKALTYMTTDPLRWSKKFGLVRRSFTADEWDFANPHYCAGDHRVIHLGDPRFLFHGNNSGMYAMYWRMAEMYEHLGNTERATQLRKDGESLRERANAKLFFGNIYGHMIPETLDEKEVYALVGDERKRMSLSTGYTINRGMPTHEMAVKILKEYRHRGREKKKQSFAEWWTMDPSYTPEQWPGQQTNLAGCPEGHYMNGGICSIIAGEIAKAAFDHGMENYGVDILDRVWELMQRDGNRLHQIYKRLPENPQLLSTRFQHVDLRSVVNRGLKHNATVGVEAWTSEGVNDMHNLPTGKRSFGAIEFDVIDPKKNAGRAVLRIDPRSDIAPTKVTIPVANLKGKSLYFMHALAHSVAGGSVAGIYDIHYEDGTTHRLYIREGKEIGLWWGISERAVDRATTRRAWRGPNGEWKNVGLFMFGWNNPHPDKAITAIRVEATPAASRGGGIMLAAISLSDQPVQFEVDIRSYGLPDCWAQAAVYYAIAEGLAGIEDKGTAFSKVKVSPRWSSTDATQAQATLHYPASDGYCSYDYRLDRKARRIHLDLTGSFREAQIHCLIPAGKAKRVLLDGKEIPFETSRVEKSTYTDFTLTSLPTAPIVIEF